MSSLPSRFDKLLKFDFGEVKADHSVRYLGTKIIDSGNLSDLPFETNKANTVFHTQNYVELESSETNVYRVVITDKCGNQRVETLEPCIPCEWHASDKPTDDPFTYYALDELITFTVDCPCQDDCNWGFTTDKINVNANVTKLNLIASNITNGEYPEVHINWPGDEQENTIYGRQNDCCYWRINGKNDYKLTHEEFEAGEALVVNVSLILSSEVLCSVDVPIDAWTSNAERGVLGQFNHDFLLNWEQEEDIMYGTSWKVIDFCSPVKFDTYAMGNQDEIPDSYIDGVFDYEYVGRIIEYVPNNWLNPCESDGALLSMLSYGGKMIDSWTYIPENFSLGHQPSSSYQGASWSHFPEYVGNISSKLPNFAISSPDGGPFSLYIGDRVCASDCNVKGYCLFDAAEMLGFTTEYNIEATYCKCQASNPIGDSDGDNIPDDIDPCPDDPDPLCDDSSGTGGTGGGGGGGGDDDTDCNVTFDGDACRVIVVCDMEIEQVFQGTAFNWSLARAFEDCGTCNDGSPCIYCFDATICVVPGEPQLFSEKVYVQEYTSNSPSPVLVGNSEGCPEGSNLRIKHICNGNVIHTSECFSSGTSPFFCIPSLNEQMIIELYNNYQLSNNESGLDQIGVFSHEESSDITTQPNHDLPFTSHITPNPVRSSFHLVVQSPELYESPFSVLSADGRQYLTGDLDVKSQESEFYFDLDLLPSGTYFLRFLGADGKIVTHKIVKL